MHGVLKTAGARPVGNAREAASDSGSREGAKQGGGERKKESWMGDMEAVQAEYQAATIKEGWCCQRGTREG